MKKKIDDADVTSYIEHLVSISGAASVSEDFTVLDHHGQEMLFDKKPAKIFSTQLVAGDYHLLNPFKETAIITAPQKWLTNMLTSTLEEHIKAIILDVIATISDTDAEVPTEKLKLTSKFVKDVTKNSLAQAKKILGVRGATVSAYFENKAKTGQLQTRLFDEGFRVEFSKTVSNKNWELVQGLFCEIVGTNDFHKVYQEKSTVVGMAKFETFIKLFARLMERIDPFIIEWIDTSMQPALLNEICSNLTLCQKLSAYMVIPTPKDSKEKPSNAAPWNRLPVSKPSSVRSLMGRTTIPAVATPAPRPTIAVGGNTTRQVATDQPKLILSSGTGEAHRPMPPLPPHVRKNISGVTNILR